MRSVARFRILPGIVLSVLAVSVADAQLRVATWNISNYNGGRVADIQTVVYGAYQGRWLSPDVILAQEFLNSAAMTTFVNALNTAAGSPHDWAAATWVNGPDTNGVFFYRTSKATFVGTPVVVSAGGNSPNPPRNTVRYAVRLHGYTSNQAVLYCYNSHMKAGDTGDDQARRLLEAQRIRGNAQLLDPNSTFLLAGDFNIPSSAQSAYAELVESQGNDAGRFFDPIVTPGAWHNNAAYTFVHTQDPVASTGGMNDRYDQILLSGNLIDGDGFDYIGNPATPYSTTTWNDVNHSYRAWGNDGTSFNAGLTVNGNTMVGAAIAQAIINCATTQGGHIPAFLDLRVPPEVSSDTTIDFGLVRQNGVAQEPLTVWNSGDVALWNAAGIADLRYSLTASAGFTAPGGPFVDPAGGSVNQHVIAMDTSTVGQKNGTLTIASNAPDEPSRPVTLTGVVLPPPSLLGDLNCDGLVNFADIDPFVLALSGYADYHAAYPNCPWLNADCNGNGTVDFGDIDPFVALLAG